MSEIEYLDSINRRAQEIFNLAVAARDDANAVITLTQAMKEDLLKRKIELQRAELADRKAGK